MNLDENKYLRCQVKRKSNIIYIGIYIVIFVIIFTCVTAMCTFVNINNIYTKTMYDLLNYNVKNVDNNYDSINDIDHITTIVDSIEYTNPYIHLSENEGMSLKFYLDPNEDYLNITSGRLMENDNEIICNENFYPYDAYVDDVIKIDKNKVLHSNDLIGKKYFLRIDDDKIEEVTVVGTFSSGEKNLDEMDVCYAKTSLSKKLSNGCSGYHSYKDPLGREVVECIPYEGKTIRIDSLDNISYVKEQLKKLGYSYYQYSEVDATELQMLLTITPFILLIVLLISIVILDIYLKKKINVRKKQYGILKTLGFDEKRIVKFELRETSLLFIISYIISIVLFIVGFYVTKDAFLDQFEYYGYSLIIPYLSLLIVSMIIVALIWLLSSRKIKRIVNKDVMDLLKD